MAKFYGIIGYAITEETKPGVWMPRIVDKPYFGDLIRSSRRLESTSKVNDDVSLENQISIVADPFAYENFHNIRYVEYLGAKWKVSNIEVQYPRLLLTVGGVWHEREQE